MSLYLYEMASQTSMQFDVPSKEVIKSAIEQPIEFIRLMPTLQKHRDEVLKKDTYAHYTRYYEWRGLL